MKDKLLIIGASGHGKVVADIAIRMNKWASISFLDDDTAIDKTMGVNVIGSLRDIPRFIDTHEIIVGIGNNRIRETLHKKLEGLGANIPTLVHPESILAKDVKIDSGTVVMAGTVINCNSVIGKSCIINTGSTVDHDNVVEDFVHISPGVNLAGNVNVGRGSWLGIGSTISHNIDITSYSIVGAGSVVIQDIIEAGTYVGVPVKKI